jgi:hypothetical protein
MIGPKSGATAIDSKPTHASEEDARYLIFIITLSDKLRNFRCNQHIPCCGLIAAPGFGSRFSTHKQTNMVRRPAFTER